MKVLKRVIVIAATLLFGFASTGSAQDRSAAWAQGRSEIVPARSEATRDQELKGIRKTLRIAVTGSVDWRDSDTRVSFQSSQSVPSEPRTWIARHPVLFGTLVGFGTGFLIGYLPGDDGVFDDFVASFNGLVIGGIGAGAGAVVGYAVSLR
jgi:hypothetical protein